MIDEKFALLRTHRNNIMRYRRLLNTKLTECERQFIERRLSEERSAMEKLAASTFRPAAKYCADRALFQLLLAAPYLDASAIAPSSFETSAPHGWVGRRRGNDKPKH